MTKDEEMISRETGDNMVEEIKLQIFSSQKLVYQDKNGNTFEFDDNIKSIDDLCEEYIKLLNRPIQYKPVELPSFTEEDYCLMADELGVCTLERRAGFLIGFRKALELMRERMESGK